MLSSIDIKKQIIQESDISGIRRRTENLIDVNQEQALIEQADALERLTSEKGWIFLEAYMMKVIMIFRDLQFCRKLPGRSLC